MLRILAVAVALLALTGPASAAPPSRTALFRHAERVTAERDSTAGNATGRARVRLTVYRRHLDRLLASGRIAEAKEVARTLARMHARAGNRTEARWVRRQADVFGFERERENRAPLRAVPLEAQVEMALLEDRARDRPGAADRAQTRRLTRLAGLYQQHNLLQEAAWTYAAAGPRHAARARRAEARLERVLAGPVVRLHDVVIDNRPLKLAELAGGVFAVFKPKAELPRAERSAFPDYHAYKVDRLLDLNVVPTTALRTGARAINGVEGTLQYFFKYGATLKGLGFANREHQGARIRDLRAVLSDPDGHNGNVFVLPLGLEAAVDTEGAFSFNTAMDRRIQDDAIAERLRRVDPAVLRRAVGKPVAAGLLRHWSTILSDRRATR